MPKKRTKDAIGFEDFAFEQIHYPQGTNHLLAIAINNYVYAPQLYNCVDDVKKLIKELKARYKFNEEHIYTLFDEEATLSNIYKELMNLSKKISDKDNIIIYFSGHGYYNKENSSGHLVPVEANRNAIWEYISNENLLKLIQAIKSFHTLLIIDSCFSGSLILNDKRFDSTKLAENLGRYSSRWGIAAGRIELVEDGFQGNNSPFSNALLDYLRSNTSAKFPVSDLIQYVKRVTPHNANQTPVAGPLFKTGDKGGEFIFELANEEVISWAQAKKTNTIDAYNQFTLTYPNSLYLDEAKQAIHLLESQKNWNQIKDMQDKTAQEVEQKMLALDTFISSFSNKDLSFKAEDLKKELLDKKAFLEAGYDLSLLEAFAQKETIYRQAAKNRINTIKSSLAENKEPFSKKIIRSGKYLVPLFAILIFILLQTDFFNYSYELIDPDKAKNKEKILVKLPDFNDGMDDFSLYKNKLLSLGIKVEILKKDFNQRLMDNTILDVYFEGNKITDSLKNGFFIQEGKTLEFIISEKRWNQFSIPNLVCQPFKSAEFILANSNLTVGSVIVDLSVKNEDKAYVWKQVPPYINEEYIEMGEKIDLYLTQERPKDCSD